MFLQNPSNCFHAIKNNSIFLSFHTVYFYLYSIILNYSTVWSQCNSFFYCRLISVVHQVPNNFLSYCRRADDEWQITRKTKIVLCILWNIGRSQYGNIHNVMSWNIMIWLFLYEKFCFILCCYIILLNKFIIIFVYFINSYRYCWELQTR